MTDPTGLVHREIHLNQIGKIWLSFQKTIYLYLNQIKYIYLSHSILKDRCIYVDHTGLPPKMTLTDKLTNSLLIQLTIWQTGNSLLIWKIAYPTNRQFTYLKNVLFNWQTIYLSEKDYLSDWLTDSLLIWKMYYLTDRQFIYLKNWLSDWLSDSLRIWKIAYLTDRQLTYLNNWLSNWQRV